MSSPPEVLERTIRGWVDDGDSAVEYAERVDDRWAVRMRQGVRDATTVWWTVGERSVRAEALVIPPPAPDGCREVYRQCLVRNGSAWRCSFALDEEGAVVLRARVPVERVDELELELVLGEIYEAIEVSFRPLIDAAFGREKSR